MPTNCSLGVKQPVNNNYPLIILIILANYTLLIGRKTSALKMHIG